MNGGGSYITLDANAIESATAGDFRTRAGNYIRQETASEKINFPVIPIIEPGIRSLRFAFPGTDASVESMDWMLNKPYRIIDSEGKTLALGTVDESGRFPRIETQNDEVLKLIIGEEKWSFKEYVSEIESNSEDLIDEQKMEIADNADETDSEDEWRIMDEISDFYSDALDKLDDELPSIAASIIAKVINSAKV